MLEFDYESIRKLIEDYHNADVSEITEQLQKITKSYRGKKYRDKFLKSAGISLEVFYQINCASKEYRPSFEAFVRIMSVGVNPELTDSSDVMERGIRKSTLFSGYDSISEYQKLYYQNVTKQKRQNNKHKK